MAENTNTERAKFEEWYAKRHPTPVHENATWAHASKIDDWEVWQARASLSLPAAGQEPVAQSSDATVILSKICDLLHIGKLARTESTIMTNVENAVRFSGLLHTLERELFPQPELPDDDDPYATVADDLPAPNCWGAKDEADYVAQFRAALAARAAAPQPAVAAGWVSIATAPEGQLVAVGWLDREDTEHPERFEFDYLEDGCWMQWHEHAEHVEVIGGHGVSYTPPYTHWMPLGTLPPAPSTEGESRGAQ
jgi:hypothetical protein